MSADPKKKNKGLAGGKVVIRDVARYQSIVLGNSTEGLAFVSAKEKRRVSPQSGLAKYVLDSTHRSVSRNGLTLHIGPTVVDKLRIEAKASGTTLGKYISERLLGGSEQPSLEEIEELESLTEKVNSLIPKMEENILQISSEIKALQDENREFFERLKGVS